MNESIDKKDTSQFDYLSINFYFSTFTILLIKYYYYYYTYYLLVITM